MLQKLGLFFLLFFMSNSGYFRFIKPDAATTRSNTGRPTVNVPVLSMISVSILRKDSQWLLHRGTTHHE